MIIYRYGPTREDFLPDDPEEKRLIDQEIVDWVKSLPLAQSEDEEWPPHYIRPSKCPPAYSNGLKRKTKVRDI